MKNNYRLVDLRADPYNETNIIKILNLFQEENKDYENINLRRSFLINFRDNLQN